MADGTLKLDKPKAALTSPQVLFLRPSPSQRGCHLLPGAQAHEIIKGQRHLTPLGVTQLTGLSAAPSKHPEKLPIPHTALLSACYLEYRAISPFVCSSLRPAFHRAVLLKAVTAHVTPPPGSTPRPARPWRLACGSSAEPVTVTVTESWPPALHPWSTCVLALSSTQRFLTGNS